MTLDDDLRLVRSGAEALAQAEVGTPFPPPLSSAWRAQEFGEALLRVLTELESRRA
jgi:hypothetical protein